MTPRTRRGLRAAKLRTERAAEHLLHLETLASEFEQRNPEPLTALVDRKSLESKSAPPGVVLDWSKAEGVTSAARVSILAGEVVYNLRTALDYLTYELAWLDSRHENPRTQFPIDSDEGVFRKRRRNWLKGISDQHVLEIERYQPFAGCVWTARLKALSNQDKHRVLVPSFREFAGNFRLDSSLVEDVPGSPDKVRLHMPQQSASLVIEEHGPVVPILTELLVEVDRVLLGFQGDFGESDKLEFRDRDEGSSQ